jgi:hypothetical protein
VTCQPSAGGFTCNATRIGGLAPYAVRWRGVSNAAVNPLYVNSLGFALGTCGANTLATVEQKLTDRAGRTVVRSVSFACN